MTIQRTSDSATWDDLLAHRAWLQRLARSLVRDPNQADDLAQEVWLRAADRPPASTHAPRGWLATVMRRLAIDRGRMTTRRRLHESAAVDTERRGPSTAALAAQAELHRKVTEAVLALDEPYRSTVLMRYVGDLPMAEVAVRQGVPLETARTRLRRALPRVRAHLDRTYGGARRAWLSALAPMLPARELAGLGGTGAASVGGWVAMGTKALIGVGALAAALLTYVLIADDDRSEAPLEDTASIESDDAAPTAAHVEGTAAPELQGREGAPSDPSQGTPATTTKAAPTRTVPAGRRAVPGRIGGQIVNSRGERIDAQVQVEILKDGVRAAYPGSTTPLTTDEAGWFSLDRLPKGFYVLTIRAEGYIGISPPVQAGDPPQVYELQSAHPIAGTVVDKASGEPVAGLYVMARSTKSVAAGTNHMAVSAEDGSFRIENLPEGEYALTVGPPHRLYASSPWTTQDLGVVKGGTEDVQAEAVRGLAIAGVIRDADGSPCSKAINVEALGQTQHGDPDYSRRRRVTSGKGGTFRIDGLPEGSYDLTFEPAAAEGEGAASIAATARKGIRAGSEDLVVDLSAGESMVGKVIDEEGNAVTSTGLLYIHPAGSVTGSQGTVIVRVDRTGTFRSPPFDSAMSYRILATSFPGYMQATAEGVRAGPTEITITLTAAGSIRGRLVDAEGKPVPRGVGVVAVATDAEPGAKGTSSVAYAGAGGAFELTGLGPYSFALRGGGGQSAYRALGEAITAKPGATEVVVKVQLGVEFSGRLLDAEGEPLKTHHLAAYQAGGRAALLPTTSVGTDDGSFTLRGLRKGKLTLRAQIGGSMVELGEFEAPGKDVEVRLPKEP